MQVLGQVAREEGFAGELPSLCEPMNGLEYGCKKLTRCFAGENGNVTLALLRYNGGGDPDYAEKVLARIEKYKENVTT